MFSAVENIALREHKKRITQWVEDECLPKKALDAGTMVMAMEVSCQDPGCVPLETVLLIVFPKPPAPKRKKRTTTTTTLPDEVSSPPSMEELIPGIPESGTGGTFKTKILLPMSEITLEDVQNVLPPNFPGGKRTVQHLQQVAAEALLGFLEQQVFLPPDSRETRRGVAQHLMQVLQTKYGDNSNNNNNNNDDGDDGDGDGRKEAAATKAAEPSMDGEKTGGTNGSDVEKEAKNSNGANEVAKDNVRQTLTFDAMDKPMKKLSLEEEEESMETASSLQETETNDAMASSTRRATTTSAATQPGLFLPTTTTTSTRRAAVPSFAQRRQQQLRRAGQTVAQRLSDSQSRRRGVGTDPMHVTGGGCPCCDPDDPNNILDNMMTLL